MRELRLADAAFGDPLADDIKAAVVAHILGHAEDNVGGLRRGQHLLDFTRIQGQWLFAQDGFAVFCREQDMGKMQRVGRDDEDGVDLRRSA